MRAAPREPSKLLNAKSLPATKRRVESGVRLSAQAEPAASKIKTTIANRVTIATPLPVTFSDSNLLFVSGRWVALALSHDGLRVFANGILANRIFADGVLADWRRRHRGRLFTRQIGGSGNAQHGHEPSRYDYDDLHDANPLVLGTGRADRVTPLFRFVCARRPLLPSHVPAPSPGEWLPTICRLGGRKRRNSRASGSMSSSLKAHRQRRRYGRQRPRRRWYS